MTYFASRLLSVVFACAMCLGLSVSFFGIAWLIATPIFTILQFYFPNLRLQLPEPIYLNLHRETIIILSEKVPKAPVQKSNRGIEQTDFYSGVPIETERYPAPPIPPAPDEIIVVPVTPTNFEMPLALAATSSEPNFMGLVSTRRRVLIRYLRSQHRMTPMSDYELLDGFLSGVRRSRRIRYM